ncbi:MAG: hypothetical protein M5U14_06925 [Acidimicrobiia bacterium]|nr:hypothetical protein [Acidimicrobiia bacterium]
MRSRARWRRDEGVALVTVMLSAVLLLGLAVVTVDYATGSQNLSRRDQDWNAALAAAEAGIDDYLFRLNENGTYWAYSSTNPPPDGNGAFDGFVPVPGATGPASFTYTPDVSTLTVDGTIKLTSTGQVRDVERTVQATLRRRNFLDYLYFTDFETLNPALYTGNPYTPAQAQQQCAKYYYAGRDPDCVNITFITDDVINGPLHTNDAFRLCGSPRFNGDTSTSWQGSGGLRYRDGCPTSTPVFASSGDPRYLAKLTMPPATRPCGPRPPPERADASTAVRRGSS